MGVIKDEKFLHHPQKLSFTLNEKDQQTFELEFIIIPVRGFVEKKKTKMEKLSTFFDGRWVECEN